MSKNQPVSDPAYDGLPHELKLALWRVHSGFNTGDNVEISYDWKIKKHYLQEPFTTLTIPVTTGLWSYYYGGRVNPSISTTITSNPPSSWTKRTVTQLMDTPKELLEFTVANIDNADILIDNICVRKTN
jgi:hypothetical protein